jgi:hypothetical protein
MKSFWNEPDRAEVRERLARLTPGHAARWGRMSAPQMVGHLSDALRMSFGELPVRSKRLPLRYWPLKQLVIYLLPFPKGAPTAPELVSRTPDEWDAERRACTELVDRFGAERPERAWPEHPAFGRLSPRAWGVLAYRHADHHLRQFGV